MMLVLIQGEYRRIYPTIQKLKGPDLSSMTLIRDEKLLKAFGAHLRKLRTDQEMSQYKLADLANINRSQIIDIEKGEVNPSLCTLKVIAEALSMELSELVNF